MKVPGSKIVPCQGVLGSNHSLTFGLFTQVSGSGPLGPLVSFRNMENYQYFLLSGALQKRTSMHDLYFCYFQTHGGESRDLNDRVHGI